MFVSTVRKSKTRSAITKARDGSALRQRELPPPRCYGLRRLGHDVLTVRESGEANRAAPDSEVLEFARVEKRALLTLNRKHFIAHHSLLPDHAGIVVCTVDADFCRSGATNPRIPGPSRRPVRTPRACESPGRCQFLVMSGALLRKDPTWVWKTPDTASGWSCANGEGASADDASPTRHIDRL